MNITEDMKINDSDKKRIINYIKENELDLLISEENNIFRFFVTAEDCALFQIFKYNEQYVMVKTMAVKGDYRKAQTFDYFYYKNLQQVIEQLAFYDNSIPKTWWYVMDGMGPSSVSATFKNENYSDNWSKDFDRNKKWRTGEEDGYKCLIYEEIKDIKVISPHNTLHEVSLINTYSPANMEKLYFEIHPLSLSEGNESYMVKILINNEEIMKEYINYKIRRKKGLKLFLENLFNNNNPYVQL